MVPFRGQFLFLIFLFSTLSQSSFAEFSYKQFPKEFSRKIIPTPTKKKVSWGEVQKITRECVATLIESLVRSTYGKTDSQFIIEEGLNRFNAAQNGPSYGAYFWSDRFYFADNPTHKAIFNLHQSSVLTRNFKTENGEDKAFYYNGPFGFSIWDKGLSLRYNLQPFFSQFYLANNEEDSFMNWGFEQALPILHVTLEDAGSGMTGKDMSFEDSREFEELDLFYPFYFKEDFPHTYIGDEETPIAYDRKGFTSCLERIAKD